jgi:hypothetical protein
VTRPCGCGGNAALECNCVLVPGTNTTITGTGNPEDPYVITAGTAALTVTDTSTVDLTLTGNGSAGTPYNVSGAVLLNPQASNLLEITPTGLFVPCTAVQDCVAEAMGPGLVWDAVNRLVMVRISTESGNQTLIAPDGGVYTSFDGTIQPAQPRARIGKAAAQSIPSNGAITTVVTFDQVITDNAGLHTAVGRLTAPVAGGYNIGTTIQWQSTGAHNGHRAVFLRLNGAQLVAGDQRQAAATVSTIQNVSTQMNLNAGDFIEVIVQQTQGAALNLLVANNFVPVLWMYLTTEGV